MEPLSRSSIGPSSSSEADPNLVVGRHADEVVVERPVVIEQRLSPLVIAGSPL
jgi:hypothetical protein